MQCPQIVLHDAVEGFRLFFVRPVAGVGDDFQPGLAVGCRGKMSGYAFGQPGLQNLDRLRSIRVIAPTRASLLRRPPMEVALQQVEPLEDGGHALILLSPGAERIHRRLQ